MSLKPSPNRRFPQKHFSVRSSIIESNGLHGKIRGTAQQLLDRYLTLARDALRESDTILAEGFFQHAEHYRRLITENPAPPSQKHRSFEEGLEASKEEASEDSEVIFQLDDSF